MPKNLAYLVDVLHKATHKAGFKVEKSEIHLEKTKTLEHGHFASNLAMTLAGKFKKNPRELAQKIIDELKDDFIQRAEIAGPGFINLFVDQKFYTIEIRSISENLHEYIRKTVGIRKDSKTMVTDTSHPNIAKPMAVHHLLSTIIGDSIIKSYRALGWHVISDNYLGDWGTQFGKLIYAIKTWGDRKVIEQDPITELHKLYVRFHNEAEKNPTLDDFGRLEFKKLEEGDSKNRELLNYIVKISMIEFEKIYKRLGVAYDLMHGESFYEDKMPALLSEGREKGIFTNGNDGAWIIESPDPNEPPALVRKSDGSTLYLTRDLAQTAYWEEKFHPDLMLWATDVAQSLHFKQRFYASHKLAQTTAQMVHVVFGRMQFKDKKMSTRKGNVLKLEEVLNEAEERALSLIEEKGVDLTDSEKKELARVMGIGSVKYNILSQNRTTNITFEWNKMLSFEGNSAPYLMYTFVRAKSVLYKSKLSEAEISHFELKLNLDVEIKVALQLIMYPDSVLRSCEEFKPNHIANYLYQLAQEFNGFYNGHPILQAKDEEVKKSRLILTLCVAKIMENAFGLLGLETPERM